MGHLRADLTAELVGFDHKKRRSLRLRGRRSEREGRVREVEATKGGALVLEVEITNHKTKQDGRHWPQSMAAADERWIGQVVTLIGTSFADMTEQKARKVRQSDPLPGDWLIVKHGERDVADESEAGALAEDEAVA